jgi:replicative DNA helicase
MDMTLEQIYQYYDALLNHTFLNAETDVKTYNIADGIDELIEKMDKGETFGMPLYGSDIISNQIAGIQQGHIYMLSMTSGGGKSFLMCRWLLPSIIKENEKICMIINEEDETRIQKELLIFYANYELGGHITKTQLRNGGFDEETKKLLYKSAEKIKELKDKNTIIIAPVESYNVDIAIKLIKKYSSMGCKYFVLDTLKLGNDAKSENSWLSLQTDMVKLYDVIKPKAKNVCLFVTAQLGKQSLTQRHLTNFSIGMSRNIIDTMSCVMLSRLMLDDEKGDEKNSIKCFRIEGKKTKIPFKPDPEKNYLIFFITKNRFGEANNYQIVAEVDYATNQYKEIGYCNVLPDY